MALWQTTRRNGWLRPFGITMDEVDALPQITPLLRRAKIYPWQVWEWLGASVLPEAQKFVKVWVALGGRDREMLTLEMVCAAAGLDPLKLLELVFHEILWQEDKVAALLAKASHPKVVEATIQSALGGDSGAQKMLLQHANFLPLPKNQLILAPGSTFDNRQQSQTNVLVEGPPPALAPVERNVRDTAERFSGRLPAQELQEPVEAEFSDPEDEEGEG